jgi:hypothetical protein
VLDPSNIDNMQDKLGDVTFLGSSGISYTVLDESKDEIRLLKLLPQSRDSEFVHCQLETLSLASCTQEYQEFLADAEVANLTRRKAAQEWFLSRCAPNTPSASLQPPLSSCRFNWGDFTALSYVWGSQKYSDHIILNGHKTTVTRNLGVALRALCTRGEFSERVRLWVDAICINQQDLGERAKQVRRMQKIYESASTVIAWVGEEADGSHKAIQLVRDLAGHESEQSIEQLVAELHHDPNYLGNGSWLALHEFMQRPYWSRLWIIQEMVMGASGLVIRCGDSSIDWITFSAGMDTLKNHLWSIKDELLEFDFADDENHEAGWATTSIHLANDLAVLSKNQEDGKQWLTFGRILEIAHSADCQDPKDKVYGLLAMLEDVVAQSIVPDYTLKPSIVYASIAKAFIQSYGNLEPLREANPWGPSGTPSWAADWHWEGRLRHSRLEEPIFGPPWLAAEFRATNNVWGASQYMASGDRVGEVTFSEDGLLLTCSGIIVDAISGLSARARGYFGWSQTSIIQADNWKSSYGEAHDTTLALCRALVGDGLGRRGEPSRFSAIRHLPSFYGIARPQFKDRGFTWLFEQEGYYFRWERWREANKTFLIGDYLLKDFFTDKIPLDASEYNLTEAYSCFDRMSKRRRLATTEKGYLGWVPDNIHGAPENQARKGDLIAILFGCSTPIVVRRVGHNFCVIGEAYIQGLMVGEALHFLDEGKLQAITFTFC